MTIIRRTVGALALLVFLAWFVVGLVNPTLGNNATIGQSLAAWAVLIALLTAMVWGGSK